MIVLLLLIIIIIIGILSIAIITIIILLLLLLLLLLLDDGAPSMFLSLDVFLPAGGREYYYSIFHFALSGLLLWIGVALTGVAACVHSSRGWRTQASPHIAKQPPAARFGGRCRARAPDINRISGMG